MTGIYRILASVFFVSLAIAASGCTGSGGWTFTINGDGAKCVDSTLYATMENATVEADGASGIPLELFLCYYGEYPVTGIALGGNEYNWTAVVEGADEDAYALVEPNGSIFFDGKSIRADNVGVATAEKPAASTLDVAPSVLYALGAGGREDLAPRRAGKAVIFYVDALGYYRYEDAVSRGIVANVSSLGEPVKALCVYPSITQNNAKALVTGTGPDLARADFRSAITYDDTIFDVLERQGLEAAWVDGKTAPVRLEGTVLNLDENGDGSTDDEALDAAIREYEGNTSLVVVHFKDTDLDMHDYGPYSPEGLASVERTDALIGKMLPRLENGTLVIVWADHGCHPVPGGGNHGTLSPGDMYVPIIVGYA